MGDSQPGRPAGTARSVRGGDDRAGPPHGQVDRSHLLRRDRPLPFPILRQPRGPIRLQRERRVSAPFRAIPPLARNLRP